MTSFADACDIAGYYARRWLVERFHYVLKSGCNIEARRLGSVENLQRFLSLANIVAWRLLWLTHVARETPDAPCTVALSTSEWKALVTAIHQGKQVPVRWRTKGNRSLAQLAEIGQLRLNVPYPLPA